MRGLPVLAICAIAACPDVTPGLPDHLHAGSVAFLSGGDVIHNDFMTQAWTSGPLRAVLMRLKNAR
jgi:hypothetical protein